MTDLRILDQVTVHYTGKLVEYDEAGDYAAVEDERGFSYSVPLDSITFLSREISVGDVFSSNGIYNLPMGTVIENNRNNSRWFKGKHQYENISGELFSVKPEDTYTVLLTPNV